MFLAFHNNKRHERCWLKSFDPALACSFCNKRLGMTIRACSATRSKGVLSLYALSRRVFSFTYSVPAWPEGGEKVFFLHCICLSYTSAMSLQKASPGTSAHLNEVFIMGVNAGGVGTLCGDSGNEGSCAFML